MDEDFEELLERIEDLEDRLGKLEEAVDFLLEDELEDVGEDE